MPGRLAAHMGRMNTISAVDTSLLEAAAAAGVTRGPWSWTDHRYGPQDLVGRGGEPGVYEYDTEVIEVSHDGGCGCRRECLIDFNISDADRGWIAAASPDVVSALIAERDALRATLAAEPAAGVSKAVDWAREVLDMHARGKLTGRTPPEDVLEAALDQLVSELTGGVER